MEKNVELNVSLLDSDAFVKHIDVRLSYVHFLMILSD